MTQHRKGIILADGSGTRFYSVTQLVLKQLLPIHDNALIYFLLSCLLLTGVCDILIISTRQDTQRLKHWLSDNSKWGINLHYAVQSSPDGLLQASILFFILNKQVYS